MSENTVIGAFSEGQAERLSRVSRAQLQRWRRTGFVTPAFDVEGSRAPFSHIYSFTDIVKLRVLNQLRNVHGVSLPELRKVAEKLSHLGDDLWTATTLYVHRKKVVFDEPGTKQKREITTDQYVVDIPLEVVITSTRKAVAQMNSRDETEIGLVEQVRFVNRRAPVIAGTRIPVHVIKDFAAAGYTPAQIIKEYPSLTKADVEAALAFEAAAAA